MSDTCRCAVTVTPITQQKESMMFASRLNMVRAGIAAPLLVLAVAACGGGTDNSASPSDPTSAPAATASGQPGGGFRGGQNFQQIQQCLSAAGIAIPTPSGGFPTGRPSYRGTPPSAGPNGTPPSGARNGRGAGAGRGFRQILSPQAQAALKACGIAIPTGRPAAQPTPS